MNTTQNQTLHFKPVISAMRLALFCCIAGMIIGILGAAVYNKADAGTVLGLSFQQIRPLHTSLVVCWIFLAGIACVYHYLLTEYRPSGGRFFRLSRLCFWIWSLSGVAFVGGLFANQFTGREYIPFNPIVSIAILAGWLFFGLNFASTIKGKLTQMPVYVWMWATSIFLFSWTFIEAHLYLLPRISSEPLYDLSIQWKSYGSLVGSFNLLVYGSVYYVGERVFGCKEKARSNMAFGLFFVGILNSFTNYGHHTYHLPQSHYIKWVAFAVSMTEIIIFAKVCLDFVRCFASRHQSGAHKTAGMLFMFGTIWTFIQLFGSLLMSWPSLNSLVHGTHVIASHAMGTMIGIDSMILWGVAFFLAADMFPRWTTRLNKGYVLGSVTIANLFLFVFWVGLLVKGLNFGWQRFTGTAFSFSEAIDKVFPPLFALSGTLLTGACLLFMLPLAWCLFQPLASKKTRSVESSGSVPATVER